MHDDDGLIDDFWPVVGDGTENGNQGATPPPPPRGGILMPAAGARVSAALGYGDLGGARDPPPLTSGRRVAPASPQVGGGGFAPLAEMLVGYADAHGPCWCVAGLK
jgi:hypothetical protein